MVCSLHFFVLIRSQFSVCSKVECLIFKVCIAAVQLASIVLEGAMHQFSYKVNHISYRAFGVIFALPSSYNRG